MIVVQCWDDGVTTDARLTDILRRHGVRATFNLNAGLYRQSRRFDWVYLGTEVWRIGWDEMLEVYDGFTIGNHSLMHPLLDQIPLDAARREIFEGRDRLQQFFGRSVPGFTYPFGAYTKEIVDLVREAGHVYARTTRSVDYPFPPEDPLIFHPCSHFLAPDFWSRYEKAKRCGVFYFWGHSYEMISEDMWRDFEAAIARIDADPASCWGELADLFDAPEKGKG